MFETVLIATDGSSSAHRAVTAALDLADAFEATVHALYVVDAYEVAGSPESVRDDLESALASQGDTALSFVRETAAETAEAGDVVTVVREGDPVTEICRYATDAEADVIATGTRGRHGEHSFVVGSVAEGVVRRASIPVLTVRQLEGATPAAAD
jgi:nucleotide-binding universal stress UspA family protein